MILETRAKSALSSWLSSTPNFKGKGRFTLLADKILTDYENPSSYHVVGKLNGCALFGFDLRPWGQKFAYYYGEWERAYVDILRALYSGGVFLDVGSSLGLYVVCLGDLVREKKGSIISVEPVSFNLDRQKQNVTLNGLDALVDYIPYALSDERGAVWIKTDPMMADNNAIIAEDGDIEIEVVPLDELVKLKGYRDIRMMKIDVEGYEPLVIEGARRTIERDLPIVFAEFCRERMQINGFSMEDSWRLITGDLDYSCYFWDDRYKKLRSLTSPGDLENLFFIPAHVALPAAFIE